MGLQGKDTRTNGTTILASAGGGLTREPDLYDSLAAPLWRGYLSSLSKQRFDDFSELANFLVFIIPPIR